MKNHWKLLVSTVILGGLLAGPAAIAATLAGPSLLVPNMKAVASAQNDLQSQTFMGRISQKDGKFVLTDDSNTAYNLDDQDKAKQYEGQKVKVTGSLDKDTNTIHVSEIKSA